MSVKKLEDLPNEILETLFERYVDGTDLLLNFNLNLNSRITSLVNKAQKLNFDFTGCSKENFTLALGLLGGFATKIRSLTLSDQCAPSAIHSFSSIFVDFQRFTELRTLNLNGNCRTMNAQSFFRRLYRFLSVSKIENLSIRFERRTDHLNYSIILPEILKAPNLRRLFIDSTSIDEDFSQSLAVYPNMEKLSLIGINMNLNNLHNIFKSFPRLKFLHLIFHRNSSHYEVSKISLDPSKFRMKNLRTFHLECFSRQNNFEKILDFLRLTANLKNFQLRTDARNINPELLKNFLQANVLKSLESFCLFTRFDDGNQSETIVKQLKTSFNEKFWREKDFFKLFLVRNTDFSQGEPKVLLGNDFLHPHLFTGHTREIILLPERSENFVEKISQIEKILLDKKDSILKSNFYFDQVRSLFFNENYFPPLDLIKQRIDLSKVENFVCSPDLTDLSILNFIENSLKNLQSLMVDGNFFLKIKFDDEIPVIRNLKQLQICAGRVPFKDENLRNIRRIFPSLEHLRIDFVYSSEIIRRLREYFPQLRSFSVQLVSRDFREYDEFSEEWIIQSESHFHFNVSGELLTVWLDEEALNDRGWLFLNEPREQRIPKRYFDYDDLNDDY